MSDDRFGELLRRYRHALEQREQERLEKEAAKKLAFETRVQQDMDSRDRTKDQHLADLLDRASNLARVSRTSLLVARSWRSRYSR